MTKIPEILLTVLSPKQTPETIINSIANMFNEARTDMFSVNWESL